MIRTFSPDEVRNQRVGIVNFNQVGSSVSQDSGRDAKDLASRFGLHVISADRPGSGQLLPRPGLANRLNSDYAGEMARIGKVIAREAETMGINRLVAYGRSAGALGVLAVTQTETLPIEGIYAPEPVGLFRTDPEEGRKRFNAYGKLQSELVADTIGHPDLIRPNPTDTKGMAKLGRVASIVPYFLNDSHNNAGVWSQPIGLEYATNIASSQPNVHTVIDLAEYSLGANGTAKEEMAALHGLRAATRGSQPFDVNEVPNTVHSSFDNRDFAAGRMEPVIENVLARYGQ